MHFIEDALIMTHSHQIPERNQRVEQTRREAGFLLGVILGLPGGVEAASGRLTQHCILRGLVARQIRA